MNGWIGVDLDGTLAQYDGWQGIGFIGPPVPAMLERVKHWLAEGKDVRIFTARVWYDRNVQLSTPRDYSEEEITTMRAQRDESWKASAAIQQWCLQHIGQVLPITCEKDFGMVELWDDRAVQVHINTGQRADGLV